MDDIPLAASPAYNLTTYRQPITVMCERLLEVLDDQQTQNIFVPGRMIIRATCPLRLWAGRIAIIRTSGS